MIINPDTLLITVSPHVYMLILILFLSTEITSEPNLWADGLLLSISVKENNPEKISSEFNKARGEGIEIFKYRVCPFGESKFP